MRNALKFVLLLVLPSLIVGFLILPSTYKLTYVPIHKPPCKHVRTVGKVFSLVKTFPANIYVNITFPRNVSKSTGLLYVKAVYFKGAKLKVIIYPVYPPLVPNSNYDPYITFYLAFVDVNTNRTVEPRGYIVFEVSK